MKLNSDQQRGREPRLQRQIAILVWLTSLDGVGSECEDSDDAAAQKRPAGSIQEPAVRCRELRIGLRGIQEIE
jgi:hypothetical protein